MLVTLVKILIAALILLGVVIHFVKPDPVEEE